MIHVETETERPVGRGSWRQLAVVALIASALGAGITLAVVAEFVDPGLLARTTVSPSSPAPSVASVPASDVSSNVSGSFVDVVKRVEPAVVGVVNYPSSGWPGGGATQDQPYAVGTGVLIYKDSDKAYFVTNNHVVDGAAKLEVILSTGQHVAASVVGTDVYTDLAVMSVPVQYFRNITPLTFANSDDLLAGEQVIAIGTPMGVDFAESVTAGIISAPKRMMPVEEPNTQQTLDYQAVIQTDAAINPGNSGGPLLDAAGHVVGINSSKIVARGFEGMGFAIPANVVKAIADEIMAHGQAEHPQLGIEGISLSDADPGTVPNVPVTYGVLVQNVVASQAKDAGLQTGDVIVRVDGQTVQNIADLRTALFTKQPGQTVAVSVYRGSRQLTLHVRLTVMDTKAQAAGDSAPGGSFDPFAPSDPNYGFGN